MNKYRVAAPEQRTTDGILFASKGEMKRWKELKLLERAGEVRNLMRQARQKLIVNGVVLKGRSGRAITYTPDFIYEEKTSSGWKPIIEDFKGVMTKDAALRIAVFEATTGQTVRITHSRRG